MQAKCYISVPSHLCRTASIVQTHVDKSTAVVVREKVILIAIELRANYREEGGKEIIKSYHMELSS